MIDIGVYSNQGTYAALLFTPIKADKNRVNGYMAVFGIITFHTNHFAIKAKKVLECHGKKPELTNIPRELSSDCGFCCKVPWEEKEEAEEILRENSVEFDCIYQWKKGG